MRVHGARPYASKVVNDWNPIHISPWTSKLFGFPKPIAHGMYVTTRAFHEALEEYNKAGESANQAMARCGVVNPASGCGVVIRWSMLTGAWQV